MGQTAARAASRPATRTAIRAPKQKQKQKQKQEQRASQQQKQKQPQKQPQQQQQQQRETQLTYQGTGHMPFVVLKVGLSAILFARYVQLCRALFPMRSALVFAAGRYVLLAADSGLKRINSHGHMLTTGGCANRF